MTCHSFDKDDGRKELASMITMHEYPLPMVDHCEFRRFFNVRQPSFKASTRNTVKSDILKIWKDEKENTMQLIKKNDSRVAITTDMWTSSNQKKGFMAVTAHFIGTSWKLQSRILRCDKVCYEKIRESVSFWMATPERYEKFEEAAKKVSVTITKKLSLDCPTRWNATHLMLQTALLSSSVSSTSSPSSWAAVTSEDAYPPHRADPVEEPCHMAAAALSPSSGSIQMSPPLDAAIDYDCMDVLDDFGYMDLLEPEEMSGWDPSSMLQPCGEEQMLVGHQQQQQQQQVVMNHEMPAAVEEEGQQEKPTEDLAMVFFEWLKSNKESISAEDLRKIKLRRATIECATKRLGGGKEGMRQLLKLILEWVQQHQLQRKRAMLASSSEQPYQQQQQPNPNPISPDCIPMDSNPCYPPTTPWPAPRSQHDYVSDPMTGMQVPYPPVAPPFDCYCPGGGVSMSSGGHLYQSPSEYNCLDTMQPWSPAPYPMPPQYGSFHDCNGLAPPQQQSQAYGGFGNQYAYNQFYNVQQGEEVVRLGASAAMREARKKRMARQRRFLSHHQRGHHQQHPQGQHPNMVADQHARLGSDGCAQEDQSGNWVYWSQPAGGASPVPSMVPVGDAPQAHFGDRSPASLPMQNYQQRQLAASADRPQGLKTEKNLRFLLQKVLKQSDVGSLGRIVLPKKEAEIHLPKLAARDGISIAMEDIGTHRVWNMRYRFWPNNKSRMYLLGNTGDFVRSNGLQEGDFIVIYLDVKCGKYMIRGVKVRQQAGPKSETEIEKDAEEESAFNPPGW